jgi:hypothetical protein
MLSGGLVVHEDDEQRSEAKYCKAYERGKPHGSTSPLFGGRSEQERHHATDEHRPTHPAALSTEETESDRR